MIETTQPKSIQERMRDAALQRDAELTAERRRVTDLILSESARRQSRYVGEITRLGTDYVVEVIQGDKVAGLPQSEWTVLYNGERTTYNWYTQDEAVLHLIACRHAPSDDSAASAAVYAARVLALPTESN